MKKKIGTNYYIILAVFTIGIAITVTLQLLFLKVKEQEERYEFNSQVSNLTISISDHLAHIVDQFNLLGKISVISDAFNNDNYLARFSQLSYREGSSPITFAIFGQAKQTDGYSLRHISGKYLALPNSENIKNELENAMLSLINNDLKKVNSSKVNSFFIELASTGKISCLTREVFEKNYRRKILISCFKLDDILNGALARSSYDWLEAFMYFGDKQKGHQLIYGYSKQEIAPFINPLSVQGDNFVFLPSVLGFANNSLSMLFSFDTENRETNEVRFIPSVLGVFLTLSICGYLVSLKKRNDHISSKVEEKTRAYHELNSDLEREIEKKGSLYKQLNDSAEGLRILTNSVSGVIWEADPREMAYIYISNQVEKILGYSSNDYLSGKRQLGGERVKEGTTPISTLLQRNFVGPDSFTLEYEVHRQDGQLIWIRNVISKIFKDKVLVKIRGVFFDITEEKNLEGQRELIEGKLKHAQKMESIGQLAAGIAHEINTPSQFVGDNLSFISDSTKNLINYHKKLEHMIIKLQESELTNQANNAKLQLDIDFLEEEIPQAIEQSVDGVSRITEIVSAMKDFSHPGKDDKQTTDINRAIESTTIVARNEWKYLADMQFDFSGDVLMVNCFPGEINQVILNMIANACYAIKDSTEGKVKGNILITTSEENGNAIIKIKDDGAGIREDIIEKVFDPFFTTKEVGQGTGQGLSLAYNIIVEKHGGKVFVESALGNGTTFTIQVPI